MARLVHDEERGGQQHHALDHRVVAIVDRLDGEAADARPREHGLGHHRAGEQAAELEPRDREDGNGRVPERVLDDDERSASPLARAVRM